MTTTVGRLPTFCVIGAMKAGTTSLAAWLDEHPDVHIAPQKEVRFFNTPFNFWLGVDWYREQFAQAGDAHAVGDATPLMQNPIAVSHMADLLPDARLVAILRNPVDRAYSHYQHIRARGQERRSFRRALADERDDEMGARGDPPRDYLHRGRYLRQLQAVTERYDRSQLLVVLFEDLRDRPHQTVREVLGFIGVDENVPLSGVGAAHDPRPAVRSARLYAALNGRVGRRLPERARRLVERANHTDQQVYEPLDPAHRQELVAEIAPEVRELQDWLGRDLSTWSH
jgi:sulfotransferase family protein